MSSLPPATALPSLAEAAVFTPQHVLERLRAIASLQQPLDGFKRPLSGHKSEKRLVEPPAHQLSLGEGLELPQSAAPPALPQKAVAAHTRTLKPKAPEGEALPFFDEARVPVEGVELPNPELEGVSREPYEIIGTQESYRLAPRPGSWVVIKSVRRVAKHLDTERITTVELPAGVIEDSRADVRFIAGLLLDKFAYHLPLYLSSASKTARCRLQAESARVDSVGAAGGGPAGADR